MTKIIKEFKRICKLRRELSNNISSKNGKSFAILYQKDPMFFISDKIKIFNSYIDVIDVEAKDLNDVFSKMQGEEWSPNGEARDLISFLHLCHTSMCVGDIIFDYTDMTYYMVDNCGFKKVKMTE